MLDLSYIRQNSEVVKKCLKDRQKDVRLLEELLKLDQDLRELIYQRDQLKHQQNDISRNIKAKPSSDLIEKAKAIKNDLKKITEKLTGIEEKLFLVHEQIPNIVAIDVPIGKDDTENEINKTVGNKPKFDFEPKDHMELGTKLNILDTEKASQISGSRFGYYKNQAAVLEMAIMNWAFNRLIKLGFTGMIPPAMIKAETEWKTGYNSNQNLKNAYYLFKKDNLIFISSSEHSVIPFHMDEILPDSSFPIKYVNYSPCFRREAGTYGKDTRGMFRVHYFNKVEMNIFTLPTDEISDQMCLEMLAIEEGIMQDLGLHYQVVKACTGDLPQPNRRMYDINCWFPGQNQYRETHSCSNCTDYQARRLNTRVKINGKSQFVHILNATVATDRLVLAIIENFQQADGSIRIPEVLWPYTNFKTIDPIETK